MCRIYVAVNGSLVITSTLATDSAVYQCFVVNQVGETSATVYLSVFSMSFFFTCLLFSALAFAAFQF